MPTSLSTKNRRDSNIFSCMRTSPVHCVAVTIAIDIDVRRKRRPRLILELRNVSTEVALNDLLLLGRHDEIGSVDLARDAEPREAHERRAQMLDAGVGDADLRPGDRRQPDERADFDVIGTDAMRGAAEWPTTVDRELVGADAVDLRAERDRGNDRDPGRAVRSPRCEGSSCPSPRPPRRARSRCR